MPLADGLVVGIEQIAEHRIERLIALEVRLQHEGLEEPGDVRQVPLGGADVRHGLDLLVLGAQRRGQFQALRPNRLEAGAPRLPIMGRAVGRHRRRGFNSHDTPLGPLGPSTDATQFNAQGPDWLRLLRTKRERLSPIWRYMVKLQLFQRRREPDRESLAFRPRPPLMTAQAGKHADGPESHRPSGAGHRGQSRHRPRHRRSRRP